MNGAAGVSPARSSPPLMVPPGSLPTGPEATLAAGLVGRPVAAPEVKHLVHGGRTILLDLRTERYLGLDEVGTAVWASLVAAGLNGVTLQNLVNEVAMRFEVPRAVLEQDLAALLIDLAGKGVVEGVSQGAAAPAPRVPSGFRCALTLVVVTLGLRLFHLRSALALARRLAGQVPAVAAPTPALLAAVIHKVDTAAAFFPGRALCLERSLTLYVILRLAGLPVRFRIGAQPYPFAAHAWVEYEGEPVGESYDEVGKFVAFDGLGV